MNKINIYHVRTLIGLGFLLLQLILIGRCQFVLTRHFCWAPHNSMTAYTLEVTVDGELLDNSQIKARYAIRYGIRGDLHWEAHSIHNLFELIELAEKTYYQDNPAQITINYWVNEKERQTWSYPD